MPPSNQPNISKEKKRKENLCSAYIINLHADGTVAGGANQEGINFCNSFINELIKKWYEPIFNFSTLVVACVSYMQGPVFVPKFSNQFTIQLLKK